MTPRTSSYNQGGPQGTVPLLGTNSVQGMGESIGEIYIKGKWVKVPVMDVDGKTIAVRGSWLKTAVVRSEEWLETEVENPARCVTELKRQRIRKSCRGFGSMLERCGPGSHRRTPTLYRNRFRFRRGSVSPQVVREARRYLYLRPKASRNAPEVSVSRGVGKRCCHPPRHL